MVSITNAIRGTVWFITGLITTMILYYIVPPTIEIFTAMNLFDDTQIRLIMYGGYALTVILLVLVMPFWVMFLSDKGDNE